MQTIQIQYHDTPYGLLKLGAFENQLCMCDWQYRKMRSAVDSRLARGLKAAFKEEDCKVLKQTRCQLDEYFNRTREKFDIPLALVGTDFQKQVWQALIKVPFGSTSSYLELAQSINNEKAIRAVASANGANAISIIVPCHRIIGSNGSLTGYAGGLDAKKRLLLLEQQQDLFSSEQVEQMEI